MGIKTMVLYYDYFIGIIDNRSTSTMMYYMACMTLYIWRYHVCI